MCSFFKKRWKRWRTNNKWRNKNISFRRKIKERSNGNIYSNIGSKDKGIYEQFCEYLANKGSNLKEE